MKAFRLSPLIALGIVLSAPVSAQSMAGYWDCEMGFRNTAPGTPANAVGQQFRMAVYDDGRVEGQGYELGSAGQYPFHFSGRWGMEGRAFYIQGQQSAGGGFQPRQFSFQSQLTGNATMAYTHHYQNQKRQVIATQCRRAAY